MNEIATDDITFTPRHFKHMRRAVEQERKRCAEIARGFHCPDIRYSDSVFSIHMLVLAQAILASDEKEKV